MVVYRFEDLRVWQAAMKKCDRVGELIKRPQFRDDRALSEEMNDAAISVATNTSEGFLRHEVRTCFLAAQHRKYLPDAKRLNS